MQPNINPLVLKEQINVAATIGNLTELQRLLSLVPLEDIKNHKIEAFAVAARSGQRAIVQYFLEKYGTTLEARKELGVAWVFLEAAYANQFEMLEFFLEKYGQTLAGRQELNINQVLAEAANLGWCKIVEFFLKEYGRTRQDRRELNIEEAFEIAASSGQLKIVEFFLKEYGQTSQDRQELNMERAFETVVNFDQSEIAEFFLKEYGQTPQNRRELNMERAFKALARSCFYSNHIATLQSFLDNYDEEILLSHDTICAACWAIKKSDANKEATIDFAKKIIAICLDICIKRRNDQLLKDITEEFNKSDALPEDILQALKEPMKQAQETFEANIMFSSLKQRQNLLNQQVIENKHKQDARLFLTAKLQQYFHEKALGANTIISVSNTQELETVLGKIPTSPMSDTKGGINTITIMFKIPFESVYDNSEASLVIKINNGKIAIKGINAPRAVKDIIKRILGAHIEITGTFTGPTKQDTNTKGPDTK